MRVLIINGSPRLNGNSTKLINEMVNVFNKENVEVDLYHIKTFFKSRIKRCMPIKNILKKNII